jgi:hypothetical protein
LVIARTVGHVPSARDERASTRWAL